MINHVHPLVLATVEEHRAKRELELERLRSARAACTMSTPGGQSRALSLGKRIREVESIVSGWRLAVATLNVSLDITSEPTGNDLDIPAHDGAEEPEAGADRVVGSWTSVSKFIRCVPCTAKAREKYPRAVSRIVDITSEDLPDGGMCSDCDADVLA